MRLVLLLVALLSGCVSLGPHVTQDIDLDHIVYRHNVSLKVNGKQGEGLVVVESAPSYFIEAESTGKLDFLILRTCHRDIKIEKKNDSFKFTFVPTEVEKDYGCPLQIRGFENEKKRYSFGQVEFKDKFHTLPATVQCAGVKETFDGVSVCHSGESLISRIIFKEAVDVEPITKDCSIGESKFLLGGSHYFEFKMPVGFCTVKFKEMAYPYRNHKLKMIGFKRSIVSGDDKENPKEDD